MATAFSDQVMWFGTKEYATWIPAPVSGADGSPDGWADSGVYLDGSGYAMTSRGSHKVYDYEWKPSSLKVDAQRMKSFYDGSYGRGKLYFIEPSTYNTNVLPAKWADPSITLDSEGPSLVPGVEAAGVPTPDFEKYGLPMTSAQYNLDDVPVFDVDDPELDDRNSVFIPIPEGRQTQGAQATFFILQGWYSSTSPDAGVYVTGADKMGRPITGTGVEGTRRVVPANPDDDLSFTEIVDWSYFLVTSPIQGVSGVYLHIGKTEDVDATVTIHGLMARLGVSGTPLFMDYPEYDFWIGGQGHAGCRFERPPTFITNSGVFGGQVTYAASFRESIL